MEKKLENGGRPHHVPAADYNSPGHMFGPRHGRELNRSLETP